MERKFESTVNRLLGWRLFGPFRAGVYSCVSTQGVALGCFVAAFQANRRGVFAVLSFIP